LTYSKYRDVKSGELILELKKNVCFTSDSAFFSDGSGKWELIDVDEFYRIQMLSKDGNWVRTFDIIEGKDFCKLSTQNSSTFFEDQWELIQLE